MSKGIVSIEIELKNYEPITFTMAEARELYDQLHTLFGEKTVHHHYPWKWPYTWTSAAGGVIPDKYSVSANAGIRPNSRVLADTSLQSNATGMKVSYRGQ